MVSSKQTYLLLTLVTFLLSISKSFGDSLATCTITSFEEVDQIPTCSNIILKNVEIPGGKTLEINLQDGATFTFDGVTTFGMSNWDGPLISVTGNDVTIQGSSGAIIDGQGPLYYDGKGGSGSTKPIFFHITVTNAVFKNINLFNCPMHCTHIESTNNTEFYNWNINNTAGQPGIAPTGHEGHNTDGFFLYTSHNVIVRDSVIVNQDDCAVIRSGSNITVSNLHCTGSHGLSISAGDSKTSVIENTVLNVTFENSIMVACGSGIHIKTHNDGGPGEVTGVTYRNITIKDVTNYGIDIQQNYANGGSSGDAAGNIPITDLKVIDFQGNLAGKKSMKVYIYCAEGACKNWEWSNVDIKEAKKADTCINYTPTGYKC